MSHDGAVKTGARRHVELRTGTPYANLNAAQTRFAETLGRGWGMDPNGIIATTGATGAIEAVRNHVAKTSARKGAMVLTVSPGYWRARESFEGLGFEVVTLDTKQFAFTISEAALVERAKETRPDLVYLSLPNNPSGAIFDPHAIIRGVPEETAVLIDLTLPSRDLDARALTRELCESFKGRSNLFLAGSTSKSHETAEYRIGWAVCASLKDADALRKENRSGVSTIAIAEGIKRIAEPPVVLEKIDRSFSFLEKGTEGGRYELIKPGRRVRSSYVLIKLLAPVAGVRKTLEEGGIHVMWGSDFGLTDEYIRLETIEHPSVQIFVETINAAPIS
ncbi:MAG TPA: aminotransferase class I/II-fold pyridoxal phosphate-dependent enzyme [Pyrinomonadaceae bacterium]|nr:aminotransferase class I/II-fold pyridoxal phosphate-dependent enzyme [Pyrinomonadaceae bacterium]